MNPLYYAIPLAIVVAFLAMKIVPYLIGLVVLCLVVGFLAPKTVKAALRWTAKKFL